MLKIFNKYALLLLLLVQQQAAMGQTQNLNFIFKSGDEGYACFRIPAIVSTKSGALLAFAEGRKTGCGDAGDIDLVLKRSYDFGKTWSSLQVVWSDTTNTCGNPAPVVDQNTGDIILLSTWNLGTDHEAQIINQKSVNTRRIFLLRSVNEGKTWSTPNEITNQVKLPNWTWYATGPGNGIQLRDGAHKSRLVIPCDHIEAQTKKYFSHIIFSDDAGASWQMGGTTPTDQVNECAVVELYNNDLLLNMRNYNKQRVRQTSISKDGGASWLSLVPDTVLIEPVCQASLISYPGLGKKALAFSNPASTNARKNMTVRISKDAGKTWKKQALLYDGPSAYSNLVALSNKKLACLYEAGVASAYEGIVYEVVTNKQLKKPTNLVD
jgi:sialidase-1